MLLPRCGQLGNYKQLQWLRRIQQVVAVGLGGGGNSSSVNTAACGGGIVDTVSC